MRFGGATWSCLSNLLHYDKLMDPNEATWTGFNRVSRVNRLVIVGQRGQMDWMYWDRGDGSNGELCIISLG